MFAISYSLLVYIYIRKDKKKTQGRFSSNLKLAEELYLILSIVLAEIPLLYILNSLVTKGIADKELDKEGSEQDNFETSLNSPTSDYISESAI